MSEATKFEIWMLVAICAVLFGWNADRKDATAEHVKEADEKKADVKPEDRIALMHPLECSTWVLKCPGDCKPRFTCAADLTRKP